MLAWGWLSLSLLRAYPPPPGPRNDDSPHMPAAWPPLILWACWLTIRPSNCAPPSPDPPIMHTFGLWRRCLLWQTAAEEDMKVRVWMHEALCTTIALAQALRYLTAGVAHVPKTGLLICLCIFWMCSFH